MPPWRFLSQVFVVIEGQGIMELNGVSTGPLLPGTAIHMPPGVSAFESF
jgi:mannose-6-phosphate isomerase-like protein (cupin superfamily)